MWDKTRLPTLTVPFPDRAQHDMFDVDKQLLEDGGLLPWVFSQQPPFYDLAYADDTALIAGTAQRTEQLITLVAKTAAHSNLQLNWSKSLLLKSPSSWRDGKGGGTRQVPRGRPFQKWVKQKGGHRKTA